MVVKNTWGKGLNSDISKLKTSNETYLDALNLSIITQDGNSSYSAQSTRGTERSFVLPTTGPTYKLDSFVGVCVFTITTALGVTTFNIDTTNKTNKQISDEINNSLSINTIVSYYNNNYIVVYDYTNSILNFTVSSATIERNTYTSLSFILGWGYTNNKLILITGDALVEQDDPENYFGPGMSKAGTVGCIWEIPIDYATGRAINPDGSLVPFGGTLVAQNFLKYKELLNLSRFYNIYKNVKCRLESNEVFRVVFTDFYNDIKTVNIYQDQIQALPLGLINILPVHEIKQPHVTNVIEGGFLPAGKYQFWYQLSSLQGALSTISPLSELVYIGSQDELNEYSGALAGTISTKSIEITIDGLDTNYDIVRIGYTVYQVEELAESFYFDELTIPQSGVVTTVLNGNEETIPVESQTVLSNVNKPPSVCKTIDVVKNKLLMANTKVKEFDVEFDARAYRFDTLTGNAALYNEGNSWGNPFILIDSSLNVSINGNPGFTLLDIPETADLINPYNDENPLNPLNNGDWGTWSQFKFQNDGITLGGVGPNISYRFTFKETIEDTNITSIKTLAPYINPVYSNDNEQFDFGNYTANIPGNFKTLRSPFYDALFTGHARGEVYRYGIVFWDLYGYRSPVKWIGDIKFPNAYDASIDPKTALGEINSNNELICYQMGIEFTLDTSTPEFQAIKDKISGWSFVRVKREVKDKTKLGVGLLNGVDVQTVQSVGNAYVHPFDFDNTREDSTLDSTKIKTIHIPNFQKGIDNEFILRDYIMVLGELEQYSFRSNVFSNGSPIPNSQLRAYYPLAPFSYNFSNIREITFKWAVQRSRSQNFIPLDAPNGLGLPFVNMAASVDSDPLNGIFDSSGANVDLVTLTTSLPRPVSDTRKYLIQYCRYLNSQYGGNTFIARTNNTYISTGHFQPYSLNQVVNPSKVFGGDVTVLQHGYQVLEKNDSTFTGWNMPGGIQFSDRLSIFYPAESSSFNPYCLVYDNPLLTLNQRAYNRFDDAPIYEELSSVNSAYLQQNTTTPVVSKPLVFRNIVEQPYTIYSTDEKIDGELVDSWRNFRTNQFIAVNGNYGPINRIIEFKDKLYFYQENAVGIAAINERVLVNEGDDSQTQLGTGGVLSRYDYLSTETGVIHQFAVEKSGNSLYHYDALLNKFFRFNEGMRPESDIKGLIGVLNNLDPTLKSGDQLFLSITDRVGVHLAFDSRTNKVFATFLGKNNSLTLSYNELLNGGNGAFESRWSFIPNMYLNMRSVFISSSMADLNNNVQIHNIGPYNRFYNNNEPVMIKFRNNLDTPDLVKVFDNMWLNTEVFNNGTLVNETIDTARFTNDYQDSGVVSLAGIKKHLSTYRWNRIRNQSDKRRMYDKYIDVELYYFGGQNRLILHDVILENSIRTTIKPK